VADTQDYANHRHRPVGWIVTALCAVLGFVGMVLFVLRTPSVISVALLLVAAAVVGLVTLIRRYTVRLQDRIIRLEMRLRLLALGREHDITRVTMRQLVALRFASDAELPALIDRALAENLTPDQIKRAVSNWQPDRMRT
jgi:drug/metabolite transporter (DMT)-like permease